MRCPREPLNFIGSAALVGLVVLATSAAPSAHADVEALPQAIVFGQPTAMAVGEPAQPVMVSATSGLLVTITVADEAICSLSDGAVTALSPGICSISATQEGDATFGPARPVVRDVDVVAAADPAEPSTALPVPDPVVPAPVGAVRGVIWFDRDRNGTRDGGEWALEHVTVTLVATGGAAGLPPGHLESASERTAGDPAMQRSATTAADGSYRFDGVVPGAYVVTADVSVDGVEPLSDSDGGADWSVAVHASAGSEAVADFAGVGRGALTGDVFDPVTHEGYPAAAVTCAWSGADGLPATGDDASFDATTDGQGGFDLVGLPYGTYTCGAVDSISGRSTVSATAALGGPEAVEAPLPLSAAPMVEAPQPGAAAERALPATGGSTRLAIQIALVSIFAGFGSLTVARYRRSP